MFRICELNLNILFRNQTHLIWFDSIRLSFWIKPIDTHNDGWVKTNAWRACDGGGAILFQEKRIGIKYSWFALGIEAQVLFPYQPFFFKNLYRNNTAQKRFSNKLSDSHCPENRPWCYAIPYVYIFLLKSTQTYPIWWASIFSIFLF